MENVNLDTSIDVSMKTKIGLSDKQSTAVSDLLNTLLSDEYVLYTKTRNCHWNVTGPHFMALHEFFQKQYEQLDLFIDDIAERIRSIGHYSAGTLTDFLKMTHLSETKNEDPTAENMLEELTRDHEIIIRWLRSQIPAINDKHNDMGTADFLTGIMESHEKMAWMLRAHL